MRPEDIFVITAGFYDRDYTDQLQRLAVSCSMFDIDLHVYGQKETFTFFDSKIEKLGNRLNTVKDNFKYVLYTDASDSFFLTGLPEIIEKYEAMGKPILITSAEKACHPFEDLVNQFPESPTPYRFMNPGNFLGEIDYVLDILSKCKAFYYLQTNDQGHWMRMWEKDKPAIWFDYYCDLFQPMSDSDFEREFTIENGRLINKVTGKKPCIVHFNGPKDEKSIPLANKVYKEALWKSTQE